MKTAKNCLSLSPNGLLSRIGQFSGIIFCASCAFRGIADAAVGVTPQRIEETRNQVFDDDKVSRIPGGLKLVLELSGPEADFATQSGHLKIEEAVDNTGLNLIPRTEPNSKFADFDNAFFRKFAGKTESVKSEVALDLASPARAAVKIAHLRGSMDLSDGGKTNTVELGALNGAGKKAFPLLNGSLTLTIVVPDGENVTSVSLETTGDESMLDSVEIVGADGKKVSTGISTFRMNGGPVHQHLGLRKPLDASMKVVVKTISDRKITKVPFDLKDIPLP